MNSLFSQSPQVRHTRPPAALRFALRPVAFAVLAVGASAAHAQGTTPSTDTRAQRLAPVVVTGNPVESADLFDLAPAVSVLSGAGLALKRASTLGETLSSLPGVSSSYFGPNASRPVIRGLDADRIRVLENGIGTLDVSALSNDHATTIDPLFIERIEVVRGPAALLYGGSAVGGVVNVIDRRIVQTPTDGATGAAELRYGGAERARSGAAFADFGNGRVAVHVDAFQRKTADLRIPGFARSARQRALDDPAMAQPYGTLPNSAADSRGGAVGASLTGAAGYVGVSTSNLRNNYGTVAQPGVQIRMKQQRTDLAGEWRDPGWIKKLKVKAGYTDYQHTEFDRGDAGTTFKNKGYEARVEALHGKIGPLDGAFGAQLSDTRFSALGEEAFVPETRTKSRALFVFQELPLGALKLSAGTRVEKTRVSAEGGGPIDPPSGMPRFGTASTRDFTATSASAAAIYKLSPSVSLVANVASTQRAPTYYELFANGVHAATAGYEIGNPGFETENSTSSEAAVRIKQPRWSGALTAYRTRFSNYIGVFSTGNTRDTTGKLNPAADPADPGKTLQSNVILTEFRYRQVPALFSGFELEGKVKLLDGAQSLDLEASLDRVRATDRASGQPLPRIAPMRLRSALVFATGRLGAQLEVVHAMKQDRVPDGELPTAAYTLVNANLSYRFQLAGADLTAFLRANNLFNREARVASSFLRDIAPLPGRGVQVGLRAGF